MIKEAFFKTFMQLKVSVVAWTYLRTRNLCQGRFCIISPSRGADSSDHLRGYSVEHIYIAMGVKSRQCHFRKHRIVERENKMKPAIDSKEESYLLS